MDYKSVLLENEINLLENWLSKVEVLLPGKFNLIDLKKIGESYVRLLLDTHIPLEEHPQFEILPYMCEYHTNLGTPVEELLHSSYIWREVISECLLQFMQKEKQIHTNLTEGIIFTSKRIDDIQKIITKFYWKNAQSKIKQTQRQVKELHEDRLSVLGKMAASMAHELRNPLFAIEGFLKLIRRKLSSESIVRVEGYLDIIESEFNGLYAHISSFLAFSKNSSVEEVFYDSTIHELIDPVLRLAGPRLSDENINLNLEMKLEATIKVQIIGIQQVISNLINNSIDALTQVNYPKSITIRSWEGNDQYYVQIEDNGPGIPNEIKETIFEPFVTNKKNGTGLGLAICKQIIQKHGGSLTFDSVNGKTDFTIALEKKDKLLDSSDDYLSKKVI